MDERKRKVAEVRVKELKALVATIEGELAQSRQVLEELETKRTAAMVEALEKGQRADVAGKTAAMARQRETIEGLVAEGEVVANMLLHAEESLRPFLVREKLLADAEQWEAGCYQVKALYDQREDSWDARKKYHLAAWERDELGLAILLAAGVGAEKEVRRHGPKQRYLTGTPDHYVPFSGLYVEVWVALRELQRELKGSEVEPPMISAVSGKAIAQALGKPQSDSVNRLARYKAFEDFYIPDRPDDSPYDELRGGIVFQYGVQ